MVEFLAMRDGEGVGDDAFNRDSQEIAELMTVIHCGQCRDYFTVSASEAVRCTVPEVATTVTVEVWGIVNVSN
jgi:hypothetical protein